MFKWAQTAILYSLAGGSASKARLLSFASACIDHVERSFAA